MVVIIIFYFDICMKLTLSTSISTMNNDNISLDVFHKFFMINMSQLCYDKNIMLVREKKTVSDKPSKDMLHDKTIPP